MKSTVTFTLRLLLLTVAYFVVFSVVSSIVLPRPSTNPTPEEGFLILMALAGISVMNSIVVAYILVRSRWAGLKLIVTLWWLLFGVIALMPQIETAVFVRTVSADFLIRLLLTGAVFSAIFSMLAVAIFNKIRTTGRTGSGAWWCQLTLAQWIWRLSVIAMVYVVIYFTFGYFVAWRNPAVAAYYGGSDPGSYFAQLHNVWRETPWLPFLQIGRGLLWTSLAIPVIRLMKGRWWEAAMAVSLFFSVVMNTQLLLPNPLMPTEVRMSHLLETATSNFLFGWIVVWLLRPLAEER
jgi:hypothetical protein